MEYQVRLAFDPANAYLLAERGRVYLLLNDVHRAVQDCTAALKLNRDCVTALEVRAEAYSRQKLYQEVIADCSERCGWNRPTNRPICSAAVLTWIGARPTSRRLRIARRPFASPRIFAKPW